MTTVGAPLDSNGTRMQSNGSSPAPPESQSLSHDQLVRMIREQMEELQQKLHLTLKPGSTKEPGVVHTRRDTWKGSRLKVVLAMEPMQFGENEVVFRNFSYFLQSLKILPEKTHIKFALDLRTEHGDEVDLSSMGSKKKRPEATLVNEDNVAVNYVVQEPKRAEHSLLNVEQRKIAFETIGVCAGVSSQHLPTGEDKFVFRATACNLNEAMWIRCFGDLPLPSATSEPFIVCTDRAAKEVAKKQALKRQREEGAVQEVGNQ